MRTNSLLLRGVPCVLLAVLGGGCDPAVVDPLPVPPEGAGFQLHTEPLYVPPGTENQDCYFFRIPSGGETFVHRILMRQTQGTHHMNIFRVKTQLELRGDNGTIIRGGNDTTNPCWKSANWADWPLVVNTQSSEPGKETTDFTLPPGVVHRFEPGELIMMQSHYVNATTQDTPGPAQVWVNFEYLPKDQVKAELGTLFATNQNIEICPGQTRYFEKVCRTTQPVTVVAANGHFHSRGVRFQMNTWDEAAGKGPLFYDNTAWDDPIMATNLAVQIPAGGGVLYRCEFKAPADSCGDPTKNCCYRFGPKVETSEHCNAFVYYYPRVGTDLPCF